MPSLSAIVPATNSPATLSRCLAAIRAADEAPDELIVADRPPGGGPAAARNAGAARARGEVVVFVDADVVVHRDAFARIRAAFASEPGLCAVFGSYDQMPAAPGLVARFRNLLHHHIHQRAGGPAMTFWAGLGAIRRDRFLKVGGFDAERFRAPHVEDIELGMRLHEAGDRLEVDPQIQGTHLKSWSLASMLWTDLTRRGVPWLTMLMRRGGLPSVLNLAWRHRLSALSWVLFVALLAAGLVAVAAGAAAPALTAPLLPLLVVGVLNRRFYVLLWRSLGRRGAAAGFAVHGLHLLAAALAVPVALVVYARERRRVGAAPGGLPPLEDASTLSDPAEAAAPAMMTEAGAGEARP